MEALPSICLRHSPRDPRPPRSARTWRCPALLGFALATPFLALAGGESQPTCQAQERRDYYGSPLPTAALARLGSIRLRHVLIALSVAYSPDGTLLASGGLDGMLCLWDATTGKALHRIPTAHAVTSLIFAPDGKTLAATSGKAIRLVEVASGKELRRLSRQTEGAFALAFSRDGKTLASCSDDQTICFWNVASGRTRHTLRLTKGRISAVAFSPDGATVAVTDSQGLARLWESSTGKERCVIRLCPRSHRPSTWPAVVAYSRDGRLLATGNPDGTLSLWNVATGTERWRIPPRRNLPLSAVTFAPDGKALAAATPWGIGVWEVARGKTLGKLLPACGRSLCFAPGGRTLACADQNGTIRLWDFATGQERSRLPGHLCPVGSIQFAPDGQTLATSAEDGTVRLWAAPTGKPLALFRQHGAELGFPAPVAFSRDGKVVRWLQAADTIGVSATATGTTSAKLRWPEWQIYSFAPSPDEKLLVIDASNARREHILLWWDVRAHQERRSVGIPFKDNQTIPGCLAFSADGKLLAATGGSNVIGLWEVATGKLLRRLEGHQAPVRALAFSPDGRWLASGSGGRHQSNGFPYDNTLRFWEVASGQQVFQRKLGGLAVTALAYSPDGKTLATVAQYIAPAFDTTSDGCTFRLWEVATGRELLQLEERCNTPSCVAFSPTGNTVATGMIDGTALVWDLAPPAGEKPHGPWRHADLLRLWSALGTRDMARVHHAIWTLSSGGRETIPFLKEWLHAIRPAPPAQIRQLVAQLDADEFAVRQAASSGLARLGVQAEGALRQALRATPSAEVRERVQRLLKALPGWLVTDRDTLRTLRAIWVLERIGTKEAQAVLDRLARGAPAVRQTQDAKAALTRLRARNHQP